MRSINFAKSAARRYAAPWVIRHPLRRWPGWLGDLYRIKVPGNVRANADPSPSGAANINVIFDLLDEVANVTGDVAECGVYRGETLVAIALYLAQQRSPRHIYAFDSFEGFDDAINVDLKLGGAHDTQKIHRGFSDTSYDLIAEKLHSLNLADKVQLVKGYFSDTLPAAPRTTYAFVHLDCDLYQSYRDCLNHFYCQMAVGGIILLDEYDDPPWPGCNQAVDEFMRGRPEKLEKIERDNYVKYFIRKAAPVQGDQLLST